MHELVIAAMMIHTGVVRPAAPEPRAKHTKP